MPVNIEQLQGILSEREDANWEAASTVISQLSDEERRLRLGLDLPEGVTTVEEFARQAEQQEAEIAEAPDVAAPAAYDLRNVNGLNFITSIKDQSNCGSCVAFGVCATIEGTLRVQEKDSTLQVDLSEAHLFYCNGGDCATGWNPEAALTACRNTGVADDACYPYTPGNQACNPCGDWRNRVTKITGSHSLSNSPANMKDWISTRGPISACFTVFTDFYAYRSGIYRHVSGGFEGGHCVSIVGYDDGQGCWICKNSWAAGWGESGFFRIAYGECGIETRVHAVDGVTPASTTDIFGPNEDWTKGPYYGTRGTFFADVTGDRRADAIVVNDGTVIVRSSTGSGFGPNEDWTKGPYYGARGTFFADVTGDGRADAIMVNNDTVTVRRSTGSGFGPNEDATHGPYYGTRGTFFADVTGDGRADAIVVNNDTVTVRRSR
jgi:C1A family cysteine protease